MKRHKWPCPVTVFDHLLFLKTRWAERNGHWMRLSRRPRHLPGYW